MQAAASIILEDIRSKVYDLEEYPPPDDFFCDVGSDVPETLNTFLESVILTHKKGNVDKWKKKYTSLTHCIISAARPRSFLSPIQIGVSTFIYKKFRVEAINRFSCISRLWYFLCRSEYI